MLPILLELPLWGIKIHAYGVMMLIACSGAVLITAWQARRDGLDSRIVYELATWLLLGGVIGARALFVLSHPETIEHPLDLVRSWQGGNVFYGCIMGGLIGTMIYWYRRPFPFLPMADAVALGLAVGVTFGRMGCFLGGCCFGDVCNLPWSVRYPAGSHAWISQVEQGLLAPAAPRSLPTHPTQLYASLAGLLILIALLAFLPHRRRKGEAMALLMVSYSLTRWGMESVRGDESAIFAGMTLSQNMSIVLLVAGILSWHCLRSAGVEQTRSLTGGPAAPFTVRHQGRADHDLAAAGESTRRP